MGIGYDASSVNEQEDDLMSATTTDNAQPSGGELNGLAYVFGFALTSVPLVRAGLAFAAIVPIALAADTVSITIMEAIDNVTVVLIPNAMDAGLGDALFYGSIAAGFAIAYPFAFLANRYMIARGRGHAVVHEYHGH